MIIGLLAGCGGGGGGDIAAAGGAQVDTGTGQGSAGIGAGTDAGTSQGNAQNSGQGSNKNTGSDGPLTISAAPAAQVMAGNVYTLQPQVSHTTGTLTYTITNRPDWAQFDAATGRLVGVPAARHAGITEGIVISVSDGQRRASLQPFAITVTARPELIVVPSTPSVVDDTPGRVTLTWQVPTLTEHDTLLADLQGYRVHYGEDVEAMVHAIQLSGSGTNQVVIDDLAAGLHYFAVRAVRVSGEVSGLSNIVSRQVK